MLCAAYCTIGEFQVRIASSSSSSSASLSASADWLQNFLLPCVVLPSVASPLPSSFSSSFFAAGKYQYLMSHCFCVLGKGISLSLPLFLSQHVFSFPRSLPSMEDRDKEGKLQMLTGATIFAGGGGKGKEWRGCWD